YRTTGVVVTDKRQLAAPPPVAPTGTPSYRLVVKPLASVADVKTWERFTPNAFIAVQRFHSDRPVSIQIRDEASVFAAFRPRVCRTDQFLAKRPRIDGIFQLWIIPATHFPNSSGGI